MKNKSHSDRSAGVSPRGRSAGVSPASSSGVSPHDSRTTPHSALETLRTPHSAFRTGNTPHSALRAPHSAERGIALVITLIMLAITLVMAVAFLAIAHRERASVDTQTDTTVARLAADSGLANAEAQIVAGMLSGPSNAYNLRLMVSTNYINPYGFNPAGGASPTNVNYNFLDGTVNPVLGLNLEQNISNLWYLPRAPVYMPLGQPVTNYDFRFYLDLNENGRYDTNYIGPDFDNVGNPIVGGSSYQHVGDPEWIGMLEHPDAPHGPNNHFTSRYAFIAVPVGNSMDVNYAFNQSRNNTYTSVAKSLNVDWYMRNQGVGAWELNLAAFLADVNTNTWGAVVGSGSTPPSGAGNYYEYEEPLGNNRGVAFDDARAILAYRYNTNALSPVSSAFNNYNQFLSSALDNYSDGSLQTTLDYTNFSSPSPSQLPNFSWSGSDNTNHFFTPDDYFNPNNFILSGALINNNFATRLKATGSNIDSYDRYTYYRMLAQLGTDSAADDGRLNLNYANAVVSYRPLNTINNVPVPVYQGVNVVTGAETNLVPWNPQNFFCAAADMMIRYYTTNWYNSNTNAFTNAFAVTAPFSLTNIPVWVSNRFVYTPAVHRLLQLAANLYDATTNGPVLAANAPGFNFPHVFRPIFERENNNGDIFIVGYTNVASVRLNGVGDDQLHPPYDITQLSQVPLNTPIVDNQRVPINVYGVPWIIGAKKGFPAFNQLYLTNTVQVTRKLLFGRPSVGATSGFTTNQMLVMAFNSGLGLSFWNSYTNNYPRTVTVAASDSLSMTLLESNNPSSTPLFWSTNFNFYLNNNVSPSVTMNQWPGTIWNGGAPYGTIVNQGNVANSCLLSDFWPGNFLNSPAIYRFGTPGFQSVNSPGGSTWETTSPLTLPLLPQMYLIMTNYLQAYIIDGNNVVDYVQFHDPSSFANLNAAMMDPNYPDGTRVRYQWSTNNFGTGFPSYGAYNQYYVSGNPSSAPASGGQWANATDFLPPSMIAAGNTYGVPAAEAAFFQAFFTPVPNGGFPFEGQAYYNTQLQIQAPYTPTRVIFAPFLMQANDPLVHTLASDLNAQVGATAVWGNGSKWPNGVWSHVDNVQSQPLPQAPATPVGGRYQPWGVPPTAPVQGQDTSGYNLMVADPQAWAADNWDFPTNRYPTLGWMGRVHRGTPWQTVYLKASNVLTNSALSGTQGIQNNGLNWWGSWTGDLQANDASWSAPVQDRMLFDIFTTRLNDNAVHGTVPVNAGAGTADGGLADWSALFSGMVVLSNSAPSANLGNPLVYTALTINPAGTIGTNSPLWQIVNNPSNGISVIRTNMPYQAFIHAGDVLGTPALSEESPYLNWNNQFQKDYGINDEEYEWLPQQMMGLVRSSETRYVLYCFGQTLRPAPGGTVLNGPFFQMVTNYQVVAESAIRAVVHVDNSNTNNPHIVVESYNVLPPN